MFSSRRSCLRVPGIGTTSTWDWNNPRLLSKQPCKRYLSRRCLLPFCNLAKQINQSQICLTSLRCKSEAGCCGSRRVFALDCGDRLDCMYVRKSLVISLIINSVIVRLFCNSTLNRLVNRALLDMRHWRNGKKMPSRLGIMYGTGIIHRIIKSATRCYVYIITSSCANPHLETKRHFYWTFSFRCPHSSYQSIMYEYGFIFYCNSEIFRHMRDYFLSLFLNTSFSSFDAVLMNLLCGTLGLNPHLCNSL